MRKFLMLLVLVGSTTGCAVRCKPLKIFGFKVTSNTERWSKKNELVCPDDEEECTLYVAVKAGNEYAAFSACHEEIHKRSKALKYKKVKGRGFFSTFLGKEGDETVIEGRCKATLK